MIAVSVGPAHEYRVRRNARETSHSVLSRLDERLSYARLVVFAAACMLIVFAWRGAVSFWWLLVPALSFAVLMRRHDVVVRRRLEAARAIHFYERGLARIDDSWPGTGESGDRFRDNDHLYANDLDLFGRGSLFELLSIARTRAGEEIIASWLMVPASIEEVRARQQAVDELNPCLDLREHVALAGADVRAAVESQALMAWAEESGQLRSSLWRGAVVALTAAAIVTGLWWGITGDVIPFGLVVASEVLFSLPNRRKVQRALHAAGGPARDLDVLAHVLGYVEREHFESPRLVSLQNGLETAGVVPSVAIRHLHRLVELHDWQHNQFFAPIGAALLWGTHLAWAIEKWRSQHGRHVGTWLRSVGEFEALSSLSAYRFEHPEDPFPDVCEPNGVSGFAAFDGTALGHPLLPAARMVRNDVRLTDEVRLQVISGSNMSGKSTLLRTVGINAVLALAGAPVRASALRLTPLAIGATLRIQDSLQAGRSRFYAEITRIRQLSDLAARRVPLLFLLDELLHGTNSHDRLVGATGILKSFLDHGAIGLITTHDLALTTIASELAPRADNAHFDDRLEEGEIRFDFRLKPGPVTRSNAIALMRAIGLEVG
jgi:hypothetical protein